MKREIDPSERSNHYVLLKQLGTTPVNKQVPGHKEEGKELWHVYFKENWHLVPASDVQIQYRGEDIL